MGFQDAFETFPVLETERLVLRKIAHQDAQSYFDHHATIADSPFWDADYQTLEPVYNQIAKFYSHYEDQRRIYWGITQKEVDEVMGFIFLGEFVLESKAMVGFWLSQLHQGKGFMTEATRAVVHYGFTTMELHRIESGCHPDNMGSYRVLEKAGFTREGVLREYVKRKEFGWSDGVMFSWLRREYDPEL